MAGTANDEGTSGYGCSPDGCTVANTRDNSLDANSCWSCKSDLVGGDGKWCVSYIFGRPQNIVRVDIAFYNGTANVRKLDVYTDGEIHTQIESSGLTLDYQEFAITTEQTDELVLCLAGWPSNLDTWLSMTEVGTGGFITSFVWECFNTHGMNFTQQRERLKHTIGIPKYE